MKITGARDRIMVEMDVRHPGYEFAQHKGYGTAQHRKAIEEHGLCKYHRKSFDILPSADLLLTPKESSLGHTQGITEI